jgi:CO/xanthine dehydrogenase FAD-binding subunit
MRSYLPSFDCRCGHSLDEVLKLLGEPGSPWRPLAGGTDVMVQLAAGSLSHQRFVSIWGIQELRAIDVRADAIGIGALATFTDIARHDLVRGEFPLLAAAAREIGGAANQNRGTLGGNIANASPAADTAPALIVYDARLEIASAAGRREVPYARFHTGYKQMDLAAGELIVRAWLPRQTDGLLHSYRKVGARKAQAISKVCFAGTARVTGGRAADVRLGFGSVAPTVVSPAKTEAVVRGALLTADVVDEAVRTLALELSPIDDVRSTARYRARVAENLLRQFLLGLITPSA